MLRKELWIGLAAVVVAVIAGLLVWTSIFSQPNVSDAPSIATPIASPSNSLLVKPMIEAASSGGFAATFSGASAREWRLTNGHRVERLSLNGAEPVMARLTSNTPLVRKNVVDGLYIELTPEFANAANGKPIEVGLVVKASQTNPSSSVSVVYATQQAGNSGWHTFPVSGKFEVRAFTFDVPQRGEGYSSKPLISVRADETGSGAAVEILGVYAKIISRSGSNSNVGVQFRKSFGVDDGIDWKIPAGHRLVAIKDANTGLTLGQLASFSPLDSQTLAFGSQGPSLLIPTELAQKLNGKEINIVFRARAAAESPADRLLAIFSTQQAGRTGWMSIILSNEMEDYSLKYTVPKLASGYQNPFLIVLQAKNDGTEKMIDIESIEIVATQIQ